MLFLPEKMREEVRRPFGKLVVGAGLEKAIKGAARPLITVGDQCSHDLIVSGAKPDIIVIDFKIKRNEIGKEMKETFVPFAKNAFVVLSAPGYISDELQIALSRVLSEGKGAVLVFGEDDLSALFIMANAKKGTLVYGQPNEGAVVVPLGGKGMVEKAGGLIARMEQVPVKG